MSLRRRRAVAPVGKQLEARARAFTLVELLVVIGIIAIVISLLFPALQRAKHKAQVLASPVAYVGTDNRLHLTDPTGAMEMPLTKAVAQGQCPVCHAPPAWSPSGQSVAFRMMDGGDVTAILEPFSGRVRKLPPGAPLLTWIDSTAVVQGQRSNFQTVDVHTGRPLPLRSSTNADSVMSVAPAPAGAPGPFIGSVIRGGRASVAFLKKDLSAARPVWTGTTTLAVSYPRVDPMGEYVAWTDQSSGGRKVAIKHVNEAVNRPPSYITLPGYSNIYFCDWTDQGTLLGNASRDGRNWNLVIFDRDGKLLRKLDTTVPPSQGVIASWRKYGHR